MFSNLLYRVSPILLLCLILSIDNNFGQTQTPRFTDLGRNCGGYYEYLPKDYRQTTKKFPLLIFLHGLGESGNGKQDLRRLLANGIPKLIEEGGFPETFTVRNKTYSFVVISPQFHRWPSVDDVDKVVEFAMRRYKVDRKRIYLTGISMGGGAVWNFSGKSKKLAKRIAAIVPVCGSSVPERSKCDTMAKSVLPVWATHNVGDPTVPVKYTNDFIKLILDYFPHQSQPVYGKVVRKTLFESGTHDAWSTTYNPSYREDGMNVYEWMLQFERGDVVEGALPVVLADYNVKEGAGGEALISWTTAMEQDNDYFTIERSPDGINFSEIGRVHAQNLANGSNYTYRDQTPFAGDNYYRLSQTDKDGTSTQFEIKKLLLDAALVRSLQVFPNPVGDRLNFSIRNDETGPVQVSILSLAGNVLAKNKYQKPAGAWQLEMPAALLPAGMYVLQIQGTRMNLRQTFVKK